MDDPQEISLPDQIASAVAAGEGVAESARETRQALRWKVAPTEPGRQEDIAGALADIDSAMCAVRSLRARILWHPVPEAQSEALAAVSADLQYERRQLKKMRRVERAAG